MTAVLWAGVALLGGGAAVARVVITRAFRDPPRGTLVVNLAGALALGLLAGAGLDGDTRVLIGVGLLGSLTTFSTWMADVHERRSAGLLLAALGLGLGAAAVGRMIGAAL